MFFSGWGAKAKPLVGIDIGSSAVKVASLKRTGNTYHLENLGIEYLPPDCIVDGVIISKLPVADAIGRIFKSKGIRNRHIATSISGSSVIVKKIALPAQMEDELEESIQWEAEQYIPFDITDVNLDYQIVGSTPDGSRLEVILVAAKREKIADQTGVISMAGKVSSIVDNEAFALQNLSNSSRRLFGAVEKREKAFWRRSSFHGMSRPKSTRDIVPIGEALKAGMPAKSS